MMELQPQLDWYMLPFLVEFMIEIHCQFQMCPDTLHLAVNFINRYCSKRVVLKSNYQLVGCAGLWIAAKFAESKDKVPTLRELKNMCMNTYDESSILQMEGHMLTTLHWELQVSTPETFAELEITRMKGQYGEVDRRLIHLTRFFLDLSLFHREFIDFKSS